jgi:tRNA modification GTPase
VAHGREALTVPAAGAPRDPGDGAWLFAQDCRFVAGTDTLERLPPPELPEVAFAGRSNVGKSSLLNALARRDVAIVSEEAGTTRDVIEVKLDLEGLPVVLSDTAGIRAAAGKVEEEGIRRTLGQARAADLVLWMVDATNLGAPAPADLEVRPDKLLVVVNKFDLLDTNVLQPLPDGAVAVSALTGFVRARIGSDEAPALTQARHRQQLLRCRAALASFLRSPLEEFELRAEDLRRAAQALGRITGAVDVEDVLGEIFGRFCIGK